MQDRSPRTRVGIVTTSYPREPGDPAGSFVAAHADWFVRRGFDVEVVCAGHDTRAHEQWQRGVRIMPMWSPAGLFYEGGAPEALEGVPDSTIHELRFCKASFAGQDPSVGWRKLLSATDLLRTMKLLPFLKYLWKPFSFSTVMLAQSIIRWRRWDVTVAHWLTPCGLSCALARLADEPSPQCLAPRIAPRISPHIASTQCLAPRIATSHPTIAIAHSGDIHLLCKLGLAPLATHLLIKSNTRIVFVSKALRDHFLAHLHAPERKAWLHHNSSIVPMGIDAQHFARLPRSLPSPERPQTILFLGRLVPIKGVDVLLHAVAQLQRRRQRPLQLVIAGGGPSQAALENLAHELLAESQTTLRFTGEVRTMQRDQLFTQSDILVLPSRPRPDGRTEGAPVTALEAMAAGIPLIASRTGGLAELPPGTVQSVPPGDANALADALWQCEHDHQHRQARIAAAQHHVQSLDWEHIGARIWSQIYTRSTDSTN